MDFIYGVIYYLLVTLVAIVCSLSIFIFRPIRRLVFNWARHTDLVSRINLFGNLPFAILVLMCYVIVDSILSYWGTSSVIKGNYYIHLVRADPLLLSL
jgi:branched-subunit amino acid transport protein AzlD